MSRHSILEVKQTINEVYPKSGYIRIKSDTNGNLRYLFSNGTSKLISTPELPRVAAIEDSSMTIWLDNPSGLQMEVYKYTRKKKGPHIYMEGTPSERVYPDSIGKRYKILYQLPYGCTEWVVPIKWLHPPAGTVNLRTHFRFGVRDHKNGFRYGPGPDTVVTAIMDEYSVGRRLFVQQKK